MFGLHRFALVLPALLGSFVLLTAAGAGASARSSTPAAGGLAEVVVTLPQPPLAEAALHDRSLASVTTARHKLDLRAPASVSYLRTLASAQRSLQARISAAIPESSVRWHYSVVLDGIAVVVPRSQLARLSSIPGATVWPSMTYHELVANTPLQLIGAPTVWGSTLATAGQGMKIAIIDDGLDQRHVYFDPSGFSYPPGFPKGNSSYTTPKVIVARAFSPASNHWRYANTPFDPALSDHATHVAGIAAGDYNTLAASASSKPRISGVAPAAYLGNYKVLTVPTAGFGLDGNSPEIAAGIEAAVSDGMDVINLSLGEPEIPLSRDIVVEALDNAANAGVIPVVAAGNDGIDGGDMLAGMGGVSSPATAPQAIAVAASTIGTDGPADAIAPFSSTGPTPRSLQLKPDVTAPGVDVLSSFPKDQWTPLSGTSMASPHVAGGAAVLKERHPTWTVEQIKSALVSTGDPVHPDGSSAEVSALREGGGRIDLPRADNALVFTDPTNLAFGLVKRGTTTTEELALTDAGGGPVPWTATIAPQTTVTGTTLTFSTPTAAAGGSLGVVLTVSASASEGDATGFVVLTRGSDVRRIPYWVHVEVPKLPSAKHRTLTHAGVYAGTTAGGTSLVSSYRYPEGPLEPGVPTNLSGPETVFRIRIKKPVANLGAVILSRASGVHVSPRLVEDDDENRLAGYDGVPVNLNPYQLWGRLEPVVAAIAPNAGEYDLVFDTPAGTRPGRFTFRLWLNDVTPPSVRLLTPRVSAGAAIRFSVTDAGSGVDPGSIVAQIDGHTAAHTLSGGRLVLRSHTRLAAGTHHVAVTVSDYQEAKNMENVGPILPNTRSFSATITVR